MQHPSQGDLRRSSLFQLRILLQKVNNGLVPGDIGPTELRHPIPNVVVSLKLCFRGDLSRQQTAGNGGKGDETNAMFHAVGNHSGLHVPLHHGVDILNGGQRRDPLRPVDHVHVHLGQPPAANQAILDQQAHGLRHFLHGDAAVGAVEVVGVHHICLEPVQGAVQVPANRVVHRTGAANLGTVQEQLGRQDNVLPHVSQGFSHNALVVSGAGQVGAVDLRCVEKRTAMPAGVLDRLNAVFLWGNLTIPMGKGHTSHAYR